MNYNISPEQFLQAIFRNEYQEAHVCSFPDDPGNIPNDRRGICWAGGKFKDTPLVQGDNWFYTVSTFAIDFLTGRAVRRKANFLKMYVVVLDDVLEKLPMDEVRKLPPPSYVLRTSNNSYQWGYILAVPETDRKRIDNLLDQLIANGLAPDGNDPGMKGVTRYIRIPGGFNTKTKRIIENGGTAPECVLTAWNPERWYTLEQIGDPFDVDLNAPRNDERVSGAAHMPDHPIMQHVHVKSVLSPGRLDITCPWVRDHTGGEDNGAALFTNDDHTIGFQCHHGHCQDKTANDLLDWIDEKSDGFKSQYHSWVRHQQSKSLFDTVQSIPAPPPQNTAPVVAPPATTEVMLVDYQKLLDEIRLEVPSKKQRAMAKQFGHVIDSLDYEEYLHWADQLRAIMKWSKPEYERIFKEWKASWTEKQLEEKEFYKNTAYVSDLNQFYDMKKRMFLIPEAFQNTYCDLDEDARKIALNGACTKADFIDYVPGYPELFKEDGRNYVNTWTPLKEKGVQGDASPWIDHFDVLGWSEHRDLIMWWMAMTLRKPEVKINWALGLCGGQGIGKDWLLYPVTKALSHNSKPVHGEELLAQFNEYLLNVKHLHLNEIEMGDHIQNRHVSNKLKPIITAPPDKININVKGVRNFQIRNMINVSFASNSPHPVRVEDDSRRYYIVWSDMKMRSADDNNLLPEWKQYWQERAAWMKNGGWQYVTYHLLNNVDLNQFDAGSPPEVTDFMREVQNMSRDPLAEALEEIIEGRISLAAADLCTTKDLAAVLARVYPNKYSRTPNTVVGRVTREIGYKSIAVKLNGARQTIVILRNTSKYIELNASDIEDAYYHQQRLAKMNAPLTEVGKPIIDDDMDIKSFL